MPVNTHGDFSKLANNYSKFRPGYSQSVLDALLCLTKRPVQQIDFVDVGAGTGIWTRMVAERGCHSVTAVEPNNEMRTMGIQDSDTLSIQWKEGSGEATGLDSESTDFLTMASSFHWVDFEKGTQEFSRVLRKGGRFAAIWNPRFIEANPLLVEIEDKLKELVPELKRKSSGRSGMTGQLTNLLNESPRFDDVIYLEGRHVARQTPEHYLGLWWSVNDVQVQAGPKRFKAFMDYVEERISGLENIETVYLTRAWSAAKI